MIIKLETLVLKTFNKNNKEELEFIKKNMKDQSISKRVAGIIGTVLNHYGDSFLGNGYLIYDNDELIGFLNISNLNSENSIYLKAAVDKDVRGKKYGSLLLKEITDYLFQNVDELESIILKIADDNTPSKNTAASVGYMWQEKDYYIKTREMHEQYNTRK